MDRYTILVVEDDPVIRTQLQTLLQGAGYNTASPADFFDVAGQVQRIQPHLVLLDLTLPGESGFNICSAIRAVSGLPVIVVNKQRHRNGRAQQPFAGSRCLCDEAVQYSDPSGKDRSAIAPGLSCPPGCRALLPGGGTSSGKRDAGISGPYCGIDQDGGTDLVLFVSSGRPDLHTSRDH